MKRILVAYYSLEGNTRLVAKEIASNIDADILELEPVKRIPSRGFLKFFIGGFQAIRGKKVEIKSLKKDLSGYDLILIGTPVWAGRPTPPVNTLMSDHLPEGKDLAFFITYNGGEGVVFEKMREMANGGRIISQKGFMSPGQKGNDSTIILKDAIKWSKNLKPLK
jgi:flavodoxin